MSEGTWDAATQERRKENTQRGNAQGKWHAGYACHTHLDQRREARDHDIMLTIASSAGFLLPFRRCGSVPATHLLLPTTFVRVRVRHRCQSWALRVSTPRFAFCSRNSNRPGGKSPQGL